MAKRLLLLSLLTLLLAGCASLEPVGHGAAKWHGERHLDIMKHPNGRRY